MKKTISGAVASVKPSSDKLSVQKQRPKFSDTLVLASREDFGLLQTQYLNLRMSGEREKARQVWLVMNSLLTVDGTASPEHTRVAPAAGVSDDAGESPRPSNTGGTFSDDISDRIESYRLADEYVENSHKEGLVKRDWIGVSFNALSDQEHQARLYNELCWLFEDCHIRIKSTGKGLYGYSNSALLVHERDTADDLNVGHIAWSDRNSGLFFQLSGKGCDLVHNRIDDLYITCSVNVGQLTRIDFALDIDSEYCIENGINIPRIARDAYNGNYRSIFTPSHVKQTISQAGDWGELLHTSLTPDSYNPLVNAHRGLTAYIGTSQSDNQIVAYEKGKQLLGGVPDDEYFKFMGLAFNYSKSKSEQREYAAMLSEYEIDPDHLENRAWVRVERRYRRGNNKKFLPLEMMLDSDSAYVQDFPALNSLLSEYCKHLTSKSITVKDFRRKSRKVESSILLTRKLFYASMHVGGLIRTMHDLGCSRDEIHGYLIREKGISDYVDDLETLEPGDYVLGGGYD